MAELLEHVWEGNYYDGSSIIDVYVGRSSCFGCRDMEASIDRDLRRSSPGDRRRLHERGP
jgi:hypothetical protein